MESLKDSPETLAKPGGCAHINFSITKSMPTIILQEREFACCDISVTSHVNNG